MEFKSNLAYNSPPEDYEREYWREKQFIEQQRQEEMKEFSQPSWFTNLWLKALQKRNYVKT